MSAAEYRKIIAVDFDGTLAVTQFPTIIEPKWNEIAICKALKKQGCILILWTCRCGEDLTAAVENGARNMGLNLTISTRTCQRMWKSGAMTAERSLHMST